MSNPNEKTAVVEARVDYLDIATIYRFYSTDASRPAPSTRGAIVSQIVTDFASLLVRNKMVEPITEYSEAVAFLQSCGFGILARRGKIPSALLSALRVEEARDTTPITDQVNKVLASEKPKDETH